MAQLSALLHQSIDDGHHCNRGDVEEASVRIFVVPFWYDVPVGAWGCLSP
jgi:hypothetical protein